MNRAIASLCTMLVLLALGSPLEAGDTHPSEIPSLPLAANGWQLEAAIGLVSPSAALDQDGPRADHSKTVDYGLAVSQPEMTAEQWQANRRLPIRTSRRRRYVPESSKSASDAAKRRTPTLDYPSRDYAQSRDYAPPSRSSRSAAPPAAHSPEYDFPSPQTLTAQPDPAPARTARPKTARLQDTPSKDKRTDRGTASGGALPIDHGIGVDTAPSQPPVLDKRQIALRNQVRKALRQYFPKQLNTREHNCWEVMHSVIGYGTETMLRRGGPRGEAVNGIGYLCWNGRCLHDQLLYIDRGSVAGRKGPRVQGHHGQFLAILAQSHVPADYPLRVEGQDFTVADLVEFEQRGCRPRTELTFKLIALAHYLGTDAQWQSDDGADWSVARLIQEELAQPIRGVACGGTHRMMGFSYALRKREKEGGAITGQFERARQFVDEYHKYTFALQNRDGSFSTAWFERREARPDLTRRLQTSGHILEWMAFSVPDEMIDDPRLVRAVNYVSGILVNYPNHPWEIGHLGHALHGLAIYDRRAYGSTIAAPPYGIAANRGKVGRRNSTRNQTPQRSPARSTRGRQTGNDFSRTPATQPTRQTASDRASMPPAVAAAQRQLRSQRAFTRQVGKEPSAASAEKIPSDELPSDAPDDPSDAPDDDVRADRDQGTDSHDSGPALFPTL